MAKVTWKELKEMVDQFLKETGQNENVEIAVIDISYPEKDEERHISADPVHGLWIT